MGRRMDEQDWRHVLATDVFTHVEAHMVAEEYTWGWGSCWFADTGEVAVPTVTVGTEDYANAATYADYLDRAFFGWWAEQDGGRDVSERDRTVRERFRAYVETRETTGDTGPVLAFNRMWRQS